MDTSSTLSLTESHLALAALASLCAGEREAVKILRRLVRRVRPTLVPRLDDKAGRSGCRYESPP